MKNSEQGAFAYAMCNEQSHDIQLGLSKREYFVAMAMQGLLTRVPNRQNGEVDLGIIECQRIAEESIIMADKLLTELEKPKS